MEKESRLDMLSIKKITMEEFKDELCSKYIKLFPKDERRKISKIGETYNEGFEKLYEIMVDHKVVGFFLLESINDEYPFYLDYFAIFDEFQNNGYGSKAMTMILEKIAYKKGLICDIEKVCKEDIITIRRFNFYKRLGFKKLNAEYLLYDVLYTPMVHLTDNLVTEDEINKIFFDYYRLNCGDSIDSKGQIIYKDR